MHRLGKDEEKSLFDPLRQEEEEHIVNGITLFLMLLMIQSSIDEGCWACLALGEFTKSGPTFDQLFSKAKKIDRDLHRANPDLLKAQPQVPGRRVQAIGFVSVWVCTFPYIGLHIYVVFRRMHERTALSKHMHMKVYMYSKLYVIKKLCTTKFMF
ncbi:hypothetical protein ACJX0J_015541 [Zea mays]